MKPSKTSGERLNRKTSGERPNRRGARAAERTALSLSGPSLADFALHSGLIAPRLLDLGALRAAPPRREPARRT